MGSPIVCMGALTSCIDDTFGKWLGLGDGIKIAYTIDGMTDENGNKAPASRGFTDDEGDEMLRSVHFIFFNEAGEYETHSGIEYTDENPAPTGNTFSIEANLQEGKSYKTLIVGNASGFVPNGFENYDEYIASLKHLKYEQFRDKLFVSGTPTSTSFPLAGEWVDGSGQPSSFVVSDGKINGSVRFIRMVSKIRFELINEEFIVDGIQLANMRKGAFVFHSNTGDDILSHYETSTVEEVTDDKWIPVAMTDETTGLQAATLPIYTFPNTEKQPESNDKTTTCVMIKGHLKTTPAETIYYRLNIANRGNAHSLRPNRVYTVRVNDVLNAGFGSIDNAYHAMKFIDYELMTYAENVLEDGRTVLIEGFDPEPNVRLNGVIPKPLAIRMKFRDVANYRYCITSDFDKNIDAFLSISPTTTKIVEQNATNAVFPNDRDSIPVGTNVTYYLQIFRTGPGDELFIRNLYIKAYPINTPEGQKPKPVEVTKIPVAINTSCDLEDVYIATSKFAPFDADARAADAKVCLVADRNYGTQQRISAAGKFNPSLSYDELSNFKIAGSKDMNAQNSIVRRSNSEGQVVWCFTGAHVPEFYQSQSSVIDDKCVQSPWYATPTELRKWKKGLPAVTRPTLHTDTYVLTTPFDKNVILSKQRFILLSDYKKRNGNYIACYVPSSGEKGCEQIHDTERNVAAFCNKPTLSQTTGGGWTYGRTKCNVNMGYLITKYFIDAKFHDMGGNWGSGPIIQYIIGPNRAWRVISNADWNANAAYTDNLIPR